MKKINIGQPGNPLAYMDKTKSWKPSDKTYFIVPKRARFTKWEKVGLVGAAVLMFGGMAAVAYGLTLIFVKSGLLQNYFIFWLDFFKNSGIL